jgi:hypothetical protein
LKIGCCDCPLADARGYGSATGRNAGERLGFLNVEAQSSRNWSGDGNSLYFSVAYELAWGLQWEVEKIKG